MALAPQVLQYLDVDHAACGPLRHRAAGFVGAAIVVARGAFLVGAVVECREHLELLLVRCVVQHRQADAGVFRELGPDRLEAREHRCGVGGVDDRSRVDRVGERRGWFNLGVRDEYAGVAVLALAPGRGVSVCACAELLVDVARAALEHVAESHRDEVGDRHSRRGRVAADDHVDGTSFVVARHVAIIEDLDHCLGPRWGCDLERLVDLGVLHGVDADGFRPDVLLLGEVPWVCAGVVAAAALAGA